jgi:glycosyltransferase involved in cell wall biosynthesis
MQQNAVAARSGLTPDVLFVITDLQVGGSERQLALLASALAKEGMTIAIYSFMDGPVRALLKQDGVEVVLAPMPGDTTSWLCLPLAALHLFWFMVRRRPRIVHFFLPAAYLVGAPLAILARVPVRVMSRRSLNTYQRGSFVRAVERCWHRAMHAVLGNSRGVVDQLRMEGIAPERLGLVYNGIVDRPFAISGAQDANRARLGLPPAALVMCIVANLIPYKGHRDLIDALALAAPRLPVDWCLLVVGRDNGIGPALQQQARRFGLQSKIVFLGGRDDIAAILSVSDIGILCSHEEGFSNAILEGMAAGLPMVVTQVGGNAEAVIDGETGLVVPPRDTESLATAILRLANDPSLRARFGAAGRRRVVEQFGLQRFVRSHRALYDALRAGRQTVDVSDVGLRG